MAGATFWIFTPAAEVHRLSLRLAALPIRALLLTLPVRHIQAGLRLAEWSSFPLCTSQRLTAERLLRTQQSSLANFELKKSGRVQNCKRPADVVGFDLAAGVVGAACRAVNPGRPERHPVGWPGIQAVLPNSVAPERNSGTNGRLERPASLIHPSQYAVTGKPPYSNPSYSSDLDGGVWA